MDWTIAANVLQDRFEQLLQQRQHDIALQPVGYVGSPPNFESQIVNLAPSEGVLPSSPARSYGIRFENWMNGIPDDGSAIDPSLRTVRELGPQAPNTQPSRMSVSSDLDTPHLVSRTPPDESNPNISEFDQPSHSDLSAGFLSADMEQHLYVRTLRIWTFHY